MAIAYEELEGSPSITMDRDGGTAQRIFKIAWSDIGLAILEVFPGARFGYPYTASMPGFPWLRATSMKIDPFDPNRPTGTGQIINTYPQGARVTVDYAPYKWPDVDSGNGPNGNEFQDVTFLEQKITFGGEYLTWPNNGVRWEKGPNGEAHDRNNPKQFQVFEDINVGVTIPTIEHSLTWHFVAFPPWNGIRTCLGKVNKTAHMNCAPETLLLTGVTASRSYSIIGTPTWNLEYRISEKCLNFPVKASRGLSGTTLLQQGTGYAVGDFLFWTGGIGATAELRVTVVNGTGGIVGFEIVKRGAYTTLPPKTNNPTTGGSGTGAQFFDAFNTKIATPAQGWNHFLRPPKGTFERMVRKDGSGIYQTAEFKTLYGKS